jgi:hypothetical protein
MRLSRDRTIINRTGPGMKRTLLLTLPLLLCLSACQSILPENDSSLFGELRGGSFVLHRDVVIAPGYTHIVFQEGTAAHGASEFQPRCELEVKRIMDTPQTIPAGSFRIGRVLGNQRYVRYPPGGIMLAAAGDTIRLAGDDSNEWLMYTYRMQLLSEEQKETPALICGGAYNYPFYARYPTFQEMRDSLGDYATLTLRSE